MNEWLKKLLEQIKTIWGKTTALQKGILFGTIGVVILGVVLLVVFSAQPSFVPLIGTPIQDDESLNRIVTKLDTEIPGKYKVTADNMILVPDEKTAKRMRTVLIREDLIPKDVDPWALFDIERWTLTDYERDVNKRRAITQTVEQHILSIEGIDAVSVVVDMPDDTLFVEDEKPYTASVKITPSPGSDITTNMKKIEGIEKLIMFAVSGLKHETIVITDQNGIVLNDFEGRDYYNRLTQAKREIEEKRKMEREYESRILKSLSKIFTPDRVEILKLDIDLDMSKEESTTKEVLPVVYKPDNPKTPYDDSVLKDSIVVSEQTSEENFEGTGYNPEGPPGQEGQTPPQYKDLSNLVGKYNQKAKTTNYNVGEKNTTREERPWNIKRITVGIAIDGAWEKEYDSMGRIKFEEDGSGKIKRKYIPVADEELNTVEATVRDAIGFKRERGDSVTVSHIQFDRRAQFLSEDNKYRGERQLAETIFWVLIGLGIIVFAVIIFRLLSKYWEKRRREKEEELARQHQAMREAALKSAEEQGMDVELSVEERARVEMQENAINMAREHPEDVAQLIRTWLMEE
ncbi:MAG: flagellar M-ring protein FliF [Spirochaetales bacterium]|nr:flagellar M-ring protein FliF [Spirochaetales bacterium]